MSDLITTTQDSIRERAIEMYFGAQAMLEGLAERARENRGQTAAEYMGVLLVVSVIIAAVSATPIGSEIVTRLSTLVTNIGTGVSGKGILAPLRSRKPLGPGPGGHPSPGSHVCVGPLAHASLGPETLAAPAGRP